MLIMPCCRVRKFSVSSDDFPPRPSSQNPRRLKISHKGTNERSGEKSGRLTKQQPEQVGLGCPKVGLLLLREPLLNIGHSAATAARHGEADDDDIGVGGGNAGREVGASERATARVKPDRLQEGCVEENMQR